MSDIFISYSAADRQRVAPLVHALEQKGWSVWWDTQVHAGNTWDRAIEDALRNARCVIVAWSQTSVSSDWVTIEAEEAKRRRILLPVFLDDVEIPLAFKRIQTASLIGWSGALPSPQFDDVALAVAEVLARTTGAQPVTPLPLPLAEKRSMVVRMSVSRIAWTVPIMAGILVVPALAGYYFSHTHSQDQSDPALLQVASNIGLAHMEYGGFTEQENMRLRSKIRNARSIKLLAPNAGNFAQTFKREIQEFMAKPESSMKVLLAKPDSNFYKEETRMTTETGWNEKGGPYLQNKQLIDITRQRLTDSVVDKSKIEFRYFDTQFRLPMIIIDDKDCFLTIRLSPDESPQSPRMELKGARTPTARLVCATSTNSGA